MRTAKAYYPVLALALAAASGVLLAFALPVKGAAPLGWVVFVPLLLAARISRPLIAAGCGLVCSIVCAMVVSGPVTEDYQFGNLVAAFGGLGLALAFAAGFTSVGKKLHPMLQPFYVASVAVTSELLSTAVFPINVAISQYQNPAMLKLASYTGIWGVSFLLWLVPAALLAAFRHGRATLPALVVAAFAVAGSAIVPFPVLNEGTELRLAAVQAPGSYECARKSVELKGRADIAVWPEHHLNVKNRLAWETAKANRLYLAVDVNEFATGEKLYNTGYLYAPDGQLIGKQRKRFPFGDENRKVERGGTSSPVGCGGFSAGMAICYDSQFASVVRDLANKGADVVLVPIYDPEMPNCLFNHLHTAMLPFRAAENGVPVAAANDSGLSCIVDRSGRIVARAGEHTVEAIRATVRLGSDRTLASRIGDSFAYLCVLVMVGAMAGQAIGERVRNDSE